MAEKTVTELPAGPLYWHVENFPSLADAEGGGRSVVPGHRRGGQGLALYAWPQRERRRTVAAWSPRSARGGCVRPRIPAAHQPCRRGARRQVRAHTHPGTEGVLGVLEVQLSQQTPHGVNVVEAGKTLAGGPAEHPMEVTNSGTDELHWLIMFVVDANKPFASDATFE